MGQIDEQSGRRGPFVWEWMKGLHFRGEGENVPFVFGEDEIHHE